MASANCARYVGASAGLVDIDPTTWNLDLAAVRPTRDALVAVHYAGLPVDLAACRSHRPRVVIEDAAHALGRLTPDGPVGNCAHSDMCCFSFHPVKPITTGEGGMVTTNDDELAERLRALPDPRHRAHDPSRRLVLRGREVGYNYRLTDIQAALGLSQLAKLDASSRAATRSPTATASCSPTSGRAAAGGARGLLHGYHLFPIRVPNRARVRAMRAAGSACRCTTSRAPPHGQRRHRLPPGGLPVCDEVYDGLLSLPIYADLTDEQVSTS